jgi:hypothetical protein
LAALYDRFPGLPLVLWFCTVRNARNGGHAVTHGVHHWLLLILASAVVAAYFGMLGPVQDIVDQTASGITHGAEAKLAGLKSTIHPTAVVQSGIERLAEQPRVRQIFSDPGAHGDAVITLALFLLVTPIAAIMAFTTLMFLLTAIANVLGPWVGSWRVAMLLVAAGCAVVLYVERVWWLPPLTYIAGIVARAYLVARQAS